VLPTSWKYIVCFISVCRPTTNKQSDNITVKIIDHFLTVFKNSMFLKYADLK